MKRTVRRRPADPGSAVSARASAEPMATGGSARRRRVGVGALAAFLCSGLPPYHLAPLGWLIPWGVAGAASPIDYAPTLRAGTVLLVSRPWLNSALAVIVAIVWVVLANLVIVYKESHR